MLLQPTVWYLYIYVTWDTTLVFLQYYSNDVIVLSKQYDCASTVSIWIMYLQGVSVITLIDFEVKECMFK